MNDSGTVAVEALASATGDCATFGSETTTGGVYVIGEGLPRLAYTSPPDGNFYLADFTDDGFVVVGKTSDTAVVSSDGNSVRELLSSGHVSPSGLPFELLYATGINAAGEILLSGYEGENSGIYVATAGNIRRVVSVSDATPTGERILGIDSNAHIDDSGNVFVSSSWAAPDEGEVASGYGIIRYGRDGSSTLIAHNAAIFAINGAGDVAGVEQRDGAPDVVRWAAGGRSIIADGDNESAIGGWHASGGIDDRVSCLAADGRIGALANSTHSQQGLVCADSDGLHVIADTSGGSHQPPFAFLSHCAFEQDDLLFAAVEAPPGQFIESTLGIYRADAGGITRLVGPGDPVGEDGQVVRLRLGRNTTFATNENGSVAVAALIDRAEGVVRRKKDGPLDPISLNAPSIEVEVVLGVGIAGDDTVLAIIQQPYRDDDDDDDDDDDEEDDEEEDEERRSEDDDHEFHALVASAGPSARVLARTGDPALPGGPHRRFERFWVHGERIWLSTVASDGLRYLLQTTLADIQWEQTALPSDSEETLLAVLSVSRSGRILYDTTTSDPELTSIRRLVDANGLVELVSEYSQISIHSQLPSTTTVTYC